MDKYELFALGHYLSSYPEDMRFPDIIDALKRDDRSIEVWPVEDYENTPYSCIAKQIEVMEWALRRTFGGK